MLKVRDIRTYYGESCILQGVTLDVKEGTCVALVGRNGAGKTTTLRSILGMVPPRQGSIQYKGKDITRMRTWRIARMGIVNVPEDRGIFPSLTIEEQLRLTKALARNRPNSRSIDEVYAIFPRLAERRKHLGTHLSGGEQQMLAIGRATILGPDLLVLDEPSEGLAPLIVEHVFMALDRIRREGTTILLVEQNYHWAIQLADFVYVLSQGEVKFEGSPALLESHPAVKQEFLGI
ncbi:MAG: ABC transporter ATP-binding protein [Xanthobacteraceae bacterium]